MAPSNRNAARRYADRSRRRRPSRVTRTIEPSTIAEEPRPSPIPEGEADQATTPVVRQAAGETRIVISQRSRATTAPRASSFESTDYSYVMSDLRRVTIVAGSLIVVLLVLSLVIR